MLEVIVEGPGAAKDAEVCGANRLEIVSAIAEGGLTPSYGVISEIVATVKIPSMIMIRPHSHSFVYDKADQAVIQKDIEMVKKIGATGIVFGALTEAGEIDTDLLDKVIEWKGELDLTFHRAIDATADIEASYQLLRNQYGASITQILTSGGADKAFQAVERLKSWIQDSKHYPSSFAILVGSGVDLTTIADLQAQLQHHTYHVGGGARIDGDFSKGIAADKVAELQSFIQ